MTPKDRENLRNIIGALETQVLAPYIVGKRIAGRVTGSDLDNIITAVTLYTTDKLDARLTELENTFTESELEEEVERLDNLYTDYAIEVQDLRKKVRKYEGFLRMMEIKFANAEKGIPDQLLQAWVRAIGDTLK